MHRLWIGLGAGHALFALVVAAAAGHRLEGEWAPAIREIFSTAREVHLTHALALIGVGILTYQAGSRLTLNLAGALFFFGTLLFAGGIYAGFGPHGEGLRKVIPIGGAALMLGWVSLIVGALLLNRTKS